MTIELEKAQRETLIDDLKSYSEAELDRELGQFEAEFFLDFIIEKMGPHFYN